MAVVGEKEFVVDADDEREVVLRVVQRTTTHAVQMDSSEASLFPENIM
jgi:hypothetical protein